MMSTIHLFSAATSSSLTITLLLLNYQKASMLTIHHVLTKICCSCYYSHHHASVSGWCYVHLHQIRWRLFEGFDWAILVLWCSLGSSLESLSFWKMNMWGFFPQVTIWEALTNTRPMSSQPPLYEEDSQLERCVCVLHQEHL